MNKLQLGLFATVILAIVGVSTGIIIRSHNSLDLTSQDTINMSPSIVFYEDSQVGKLVQSLQQKEGSEQLELIKEFIKNGHLFFTSEQIVQILYPALSGNMNSNYVINIIKAYIAPLSTDEAIQIIQVLFQRTDGLALGTIISQVYDLNDANMNKMYPYAYFIKARLAAQTQKQFYSGFQLTIEGNHVGFLIDKSASLNTVIGQTSDGKDFTRWNSVQQFIGQRFDIFSGVSAFSYGFLVTGDQSSMVGHSLYTLDQQANRGLNSYVYKTNQGDGETDLYASLRSFLAFPEDDLSDLYILTDGVITQGVSDLEQFLQLINHTNTLRKTKVRINTISFLIGGQESNEVREKSLHLLKTLSDTTRGTFIQYKPLL